MRKSIFTLFLFWAINNCSSQTLNYKLTQFKELNENDTLTIDIQNFRNGAKEGVRYLIVKTDTIFKVYKFQDFHQTYYVNSVKLTDIDKQKLLLNSFLNFKSSKSILKKFRKNPYLNHIHESNLKEFAFFDFLTSLENLEFQRLENDLIIDGASSVRLKLNAKEVEQKFNRWIDLEGLKY